MLETLVVLWLAGTFCMTLDYIRQYRRVIKVTKSMMSYAVYLLSRTSDEETTNKYKQTLELGFYETHSYILTTFVALITMSILWPLALYCLIFRQNAYEGRMQSIMLARFSIVNDLISKTILLALRKQNNLVDSIFSSQEDIDERVHRD
jgi:hypothetical protein